MAVEVVFVDKSLTVISSRRGSACGVENVGSYQYLKHAQIKARPEAVTRTSKLNVDSFLVSHQHRGNRHGKITPVQARFLSINKSSQDQFSSWKFLLEQTQSSLIMLTFKSEQKIL